jgi:Bacteriophage tail sheath protein
MPSTYSYPGVYIEEIPSGVHAIAGVSTSTTAFVDYFPRGPVDRAVAITSYADFERIFGGLDARSEASYAVLQYYLNGGQVAFVVRVAPGSTPASGWLSAGYGGQKTLGVTAASPGDWGNSIDVAVDNNIDPAALAVDPTLFNLVVRQFTTVNGTRRPVTVETYRNLSMSLASPRYALTVVNNASNLVTLSDGGIGQAPAASGIDVIGKPQLATWTKLGDLATPAVGGDGNAPTPPNSVASSLWSSSNVGQLALVGDELLKTGMHALDQIEPAIFNLLCIPAAAQLQDAGTVDVYGKAAAYCDAKRAFLIVDIPSTTDDAGKMVTWIDGHSGLRDKNAAVYFPRLLMADPLNPSQARNVGASGTMAGVYARTDTTRGVWKAPAGVDATLAGADVAVRLTDLENGELNPLGVNVLRNFPIYGQLSWGARTLEGADQIASEWKYVPVRRLALFIEESLYEGTKWAVFEPNDEPLWAQIRMNVGTFMHDLFRREAFQGSSPQAAYFVKCDHDTTTQSDIDLGIVNVVVGFAPLKPAEFVVIKIQQMAGQTAS